MSEHLSLVREGPVATITITRPRVLNALDAQTLDELDRAAETLAGDPTVRAVIVTGAGERAFAAGADIAEIAQLRPADALAHARRGQQAFDRIERMAKPSIAAVNGFALGGGCELALACTFRLASETARFALPEVDLGLMPGFGGTQRLPRLIGMGRALDLLLTGRQIAADEALRIGLVSTVVPGSQLLQAARALAETLARKPPLSVRCIMQAVQAGADGPLERAEAIEAGLFGLVTSTADMREGTRAFLEKRTPTFKGE
jgi:enoyl-CoA hydratase